jgi:transcriptional regulator with XRE-family HTH domain
MHKIRGSMLYKTPVFATHGTGATKLTKSKVQDDDAPDPVDVHVGARLRMLRKLKNFSQEKLAQVLGLTFQQVQKYERADNRIGASRLHQIAEALGVQVSYFFEGYGKPPRPALYALSEDVTSAYGGEDIMQRSETLKLISAYYQIKDDATRKQVFEMIKTLAKK